jgi:acetylornithine/succinyldiaminopimelate/putrescine aminotransferase
MVGVEFEVSVKPLVEAAREHGLIVINAGANVLRLCPPLIITLDEINDALEILNSSLGALNETG